MSEFFSSEMVKGIMKELAEMQEELVSQVFIIPFMEEDEKKEHLELMKNFLEKQKLLFFRMSLSNDPEAQETKNLILQSAKKLGLRDGQSVDEFFELMEQSIENLEKSLGL